MDRESKAADCIKNIVLSAYRWLGLASPEVLNNDDSANLLINGALSEAYGYFGIDETPDIISIVKGGNREGLSASEALGRESCITSLIISCSINGILPYYLAELAAYGIAFFERSDSSLEKLIKTKGIRQAVFILSGIKNEVQIANLVAEQYERIQKGYKLSEAGVELIKKAFCTGFHYEQEHGGCAQCTVAAMYETMGKDKDVLFKAATTLAGGGALCTNGSCGAYSGGLLIIGSNIGRSFEGMLEYGDNEERDKSYEMGQRLNDKFMRCYNGVCCREVQTAVIGRVYNLRDDEEHKSCPGSDGDKCPSVVGYTCSWVTEILLSEGFF